MELIANILLYSHLSAGFLSLVLFWIPIFSRKGGLNHRKIGLYYVRLMWVVVMSAALLTVKNLMIGNYVMAAFLGFLSLITGKPLWHGVSILKNKKHISAEFRRANMFANALIVISGLGLIFYGVILGGKGVAILMFVFGGLGVFNIVELVKVLRSNAAQSDWFKDHISDMCTTGIAAYTAFFAFGANQFISGLLSGYWSLVPWLAPTVVGLIGIRIANRRFVTQHCVAPNTAKLA